MLSQFSETEKQQLSLFFEEAVVHDSFGYTIFGKKPVSFIGFFSIAQYAAPSYLIRDHIALYEGAKVCHKLSPLITESGFAFKFQYDAECQQTFLYLINKKELLNIIQEHLDLFKEILGASITAEKLFGDILRADSTVEEVLQDSEGLKGIIFGFGAKNAFMYQRRGQLLEKMRMHYRPPALLPSKDVLHLFYFDRHRQEIDDKTIRPVCEEIAAVIREYSDLLRCCKRPPKNCDRYLTTLSLPGFVADFDDPETQLLLEHYRQVRTRINHAYAQGDFLEVTLCKMLEN